MEGIRLGIDLDSHRFPFTHSRQREDLQRDSAGGRRTVNQPANAFRCLPRKGCFRAARAYLGGDMLHEHTAAVDAEDFAHKFGLGSGVAANMAVKHN